MFFSKQGQRRWVANQSVSRLAHYRKTQLVSQVALAVTFMAAQSVSWAAEPSPANLRQLNERLQQLEQRNQELQRQLQTLEKNVSQAAEKQSVVKEDEPAPEAEGPKFEASAATVVQRANSAGSANNRSETRLNYRGDVTANLPTGELGGAQTNVLAHLRFGQGTGVTLRPTYTSTANSLAFETSAGPDDSFAILAEAYYQMKWSLGRGSFNEQDSARLELTAGKLDFFSFFDRNEVAGDEAVQFLNNAFVHNPLLDSGGDIAADAYGFAPGLTLGYVDNRVEGWQWGLSVGAFGAGSGANFSGGLGRPLTIAQFELSPMQINGEPRANYRAYVWTNGRTAGLHGNEQRHTGFGLSADQRLGRDWNLFGRYGRRSVGEGSFDQAVTLGVERAGHAWGRAHDVVALAWGRLRTDTAWQNATADLSAVGYSASGSERLAELYYRAKLNEHLSLSPSVQIIQRAGGDTTARTARVLGVRAVIGL